MRQTNALNRMLTDLTATYTGDDTIEVEFTTDTPHAGTRRNGTPFVAVAPNIKSSYGINTTGPNELRVIADTLNHEVAHVRWTPLAGKRDFAKRYPEAPQLAGMIQNLLEDLRIDARRLSEKRGLRKAHAFKIKALMDNDARRPPMTSSRFDSPVERVLEALLQAGFAGDVKRVEALDDDEREFVEWARGWFAFIRRDDTTYEEVEEISHLIMQRLLAFMPEADDADAERFDTILTEGDPGKTGHRPPTKDEIENNPRLDESDDRPDYYAPGEEADDGSGDAADGESGDAGEVGGDGGAGGAGESPDGAGVDVDALLGGHDPADCEVRL